MQKIDMSNLFGNKSASENKDLASVKAPSRQETNDEFMKLMKSLEISGNVQQAAASVPPSSQTEKHISHEQVK